MTTEMPFNDRYREILGQVVTDYIGTAAAVGSKQISHEISQRLSPATIRNVLKDLEEMGYLKQPHISAGRIPTEKGLRFYVDTFVERNPLSEDEQNEIQRQYALPEKDIRSLMQKTSKVLATLSQCVSLVVTPKLERTVFKHIEFLPLSHGKLLGIFVSQTGTVENRIIEINEELNYRELEKINNYCNASFIGLTLEEAKEKLVKELTNAQLEYDRLLSKALSLSHDFLSTLPPSELVMEGKIDEKEQLLKIMDSCLASPGVRIFIGAESQSNATKDLSLITATYAQGEKLLGTLGVIGPTHMNYSKMIAIVDFTAKMVSNFLS